MLSGVHYTSGMRIPPELEGVLVATPDTLHGAVRFADTRVFAQDFFDYLLSGRTVDDFLSDYEGVKREHLNAVVEWERARIHSLLDGELVS